MSSDSLCSKFLQGILTCFSWTKTWTRFVHFFFNSPGHLQSHSGAGAQAPCAVLTQLAVTVLFETVASFGFRASEKSWSTLFESQTGFISCLSTQSTPRGPCVDWRAPADALKVGIVLRNAVLLGTCSKTLARIERPDSHNTKISDISM